MMDVRRASGAPVAEHNGTVSTHFFVEKEAMREATMGSYLEFVDVFTVEAGTALEPHFHNSHEFYYILEGSAVMQVESDRRVVGPGDLVHIPPNAPHSIAATADGPLRSFAFAASFQAPGESYTVCTLPEVEVQPA
jgi:quercetin dioxygenase-like cupin family protein